MRSAVMNITADRAVRAHSQARMAALGGASPCLDQEPTFRNHRQHENEESQCK